MVRALVMRSKVWAGRECYLANVTETGAAPRKRAGSSTPNQSREPSLAERRLFGRERVAQFILHLLRTKLHATAAKLRKAPFLPLRDVLRNRWWENVC